MKKCNNDFRKFNKNKGFKDVIIFSNDDSISVVIDKEKLEKEDIAQIQSIIAREIGADIDDIHIMEKTVE